MTTCNPCRSCPACGGVLVSSSFAPHLPVPNPLVVSSPTSCPATFLFVFFHLRIINLCLFPFAWRWESFIWTTTSPTIDVINISRDEGISSVAFARSRSTLSNNQSMRIRLAATCLLSLHDAICRRQMIRLTEVIVRLVLTTEVMQETTVRRNHHGDGGT